MSSNSGLKKTICCFVAVLLAISCISNKPRSNHGATNLLQSIKEHQKNYQRYLEDPVSAGDAFLLDLVNKHQLQLQKLENKQTDDPIEDFIRAIKILEQLIEARTERNQILSSIKEDDKDRKVKHSIIAASDIFLELGRYFHDVNQYDAAESFLKQQKEALDLVTDFIPGVSLSKDLVIVSTGYNYVKAEFVEDWERGLVAIGILVPGWLKAIDKILDNLKALRWITKNGKTPGIDKISTKIAESMEIYPDVAKAADEIALTSTTEVSRLAKAFKTLDEKTEAKILYGTRKAGGTEIIGVHSPKVLNDSNFKIEQIFARNSDGTINVKLVKKLDTGWSKPKSSVLFPESWSDQKIVSSIRYVSVGKAIAKRSSDGATLHRGIIHSVNIEVIKVKNIITSGYPNGGIGALPSGFEILQ